MPPITGSYVAANGMTSTSWTNPKRLSRYVKPTPADRPALTVTTINVSQSPLSTDRGDNPSWSRLGALSQRPTPTGTPITPQPTATAAHSPLNTPAPRCPPLAPSSRPTSRPTGTPTSIPVPIPAASRGKSIRNRRAGRFGTDARPAPNPLASRPPTNPASPPSIATRNQYSRGVHHGYGG